MSNMQLILVGKTQGSDKELTEKLATYKYRQELHWFDAPPEEELARMIGAAYALLFPFEGITLGTPVLDAWKAGVPVIIPSGGRLAEIAGEAALYAGPENPILLAGQLMLIYKDEALRHALIEKGNDRLRSFDGEPAIAGIWKGIRVAIRKNPNSGLETGPAF